MHAIALILSLSNASHCVRADTLTVFAPASLGTLLEEIGAEWEAATGHDLILSTAGSSLIARQVMFGAPADVMILASSDWMDALGQGGHILARSRFDWLGNRLALIGQPGSDGPIGPWTGLEARLANGRLAMALVDAVPAGQYGRAALETLGLWSEVAPRVTETDNVRAALAWVATGVTSMGIVYVTDAKVDARVAVLGVFPAESHPPIRYPAAAVTHGERDLAQAFLAYLKEPAAIDLARQHGFLAGGGQGD